MPSDRLHEALRVRQEFFSSLDKGQTRDLESLPWCSEELCPICIDLACLFSLGWKGFLVIVVVIEKKVNLRTELTIGRFRQAMSDQGLDHDHDHDHDHDKNRLIGKRMNSVGVSFTSTFTSTCTTRCAIHT